MIAETAIPRVTGPSFTMLLQQPARLFYSFALVLCLCAMHELAVGAEQSSAGGVVLQSGDRVVLLGSGFIEGLQTEEYFETLIASRWSDGTLTFRNLGWSGDTVAGIARAVFGTTEEGFARLLTDVQQAQPTVIIVCYGGNEAHEGQSGLPRFRQQLDRLLDELARTTQARLVLMAPPPYENVGPPLPDPASYNAALAEYRGVLEQVAQQRKLPLVSLQLEQANTTGRMTEDGVHFTPRGSWCMAQHMAESLGLPAAPWQLDISASGKQYNATNVAVHAVDTTLSTLRLTLLDRYLPTPYPPPTDEADAAQFVAVNNCGTLRVRDLPTGTYQLQIEGVPVATADSEQWEAGVTLSQRGGQRQVEQLRQVVKEKNQLYFHRYRPQNETYLFLFRKHEQGNNAVEIPQFDPLVAEKENEINQLRRPRPYQVELIRTR